MNTLTHVGNLFAFIGGLGMFLYGMDIMASGLQKTAGNKMKDLLGYLTNNRILGVLVGALVTAIIQSSSATTVMVVGFVNAGIMNLTQAAGVIMGANVGTTITAWLVSANEWAGALKPDFFAPFILGIGAFIITFSNKQKMTQKAEIAVGFGILFIGLSSKLEHFNIIKVEHSVRIRDRKEPDYTSVILENETDKIAIIGVRIRSYKNLNYKGNSNDFQQLIELIQRLKEQGIANFIIGGDFNHARVLGDREKNLSENEINEIYKGFAQLPHNYHKINRELYENDLRLYTPKGNSYPINSFRKFPFIPDDHLVLSNNFEVSYVEYKDDTLNSDHKALLATINL